MTKKELVEIIKKEFKDKNGNINLKSLDFGEFDGTIDISGIKCRGNIIQEGHRNEGNILQWCHENNGDIYQGGHENKGDIYQDEHENKGDIFQGEHQNKGNIVQFGHENEGKLYDKYDEEIKRIATAVRQEENFDIFVEHLKFLAKK